MQADAQARFAALFGDGQDDPAQGSDEGETDKARAEAENDNDQQPTQATYEFRLFSKPKAIPSQSKKEVNRDVTQQDGDTAEQGLPPAPRVILESEAGPSIPGAPKPRDSSYYFASATQSQHKAFLASAVSGVEVLARSRTPWPGCHLPWRVQTLCISKAALKGLATSLQDDLALAEIPLEDSIDVNRRRKAKPGKKRRIALRTKTRAAIATREAKMKEEDEKERAEKEKRTKRNREKKVKRKAREKLKKAEVVGEVAGEVADESK